MRILRRFPLFVLLALCLAPFIALAADCPALVKNALAAADQVCGDTGRNQACYGNITLEAIARATAQKLTFSKPGDKVSVGDIQALKLSSMDQAANQWGVALLKVQANIPDTIPGQNVTLLLFGNVELTPTDSKSPTLQAFTFKSSLTDVPCAQAPNGLLIQSPVGGQRVALTINGADFDIGSTVFISSEAGEGDNATGTDMSISTLAGVVRVTALGKTVTSIQGTATGVGVDSNFQPVEPPEVPAPLQADELAPLLTTIQTDNGLLTPLADDAAANPTIADLTAQGILAPITADNPVSAIDPDKLNDATQKAEDALNQNMTPIAAGYWKPTYGNSTTVGTCRAAFGSCGGSDCASPNEDKGTMLCMATNPLTLFINGGGGVTYEEVGAGDYLHQETSNVPDTLKGGSYNLTTKSEFKVISSTQIQQVDTYHEEGGCTVTTPTTYTLVKADAAVCAISPIAEPTTVPASNGASVTAGKYDVSFGQVGPACPNPELLPNDNSTAVKVSADGSITLNLNDKDVSLANESGTYSYQDVGAQGITLITIDTVTANQLTGSFTTSDSSGKACVATMKLDLAQ